MQALYHPDRLRFPVKRTNPKGEDDPGWVRITHWTRRFEDIKRALKVKEKYGRVHLRDVRHVVCGRSVATRARQLFGTPGAHLPSGVQRRATSAAS